MNKTTLQLMFTPERVMRLAQGYKTEMISHPVEGNPDFKIMRTVGKATSCTRGDVIALLDESLNDIDFKDRPIFYSQDRNVFWYDPEGTSPEIVRRIRKEATDFLDKLNEVRQMVLDWLISKGAKVVASTQILHPLISTSGMVGDNSTRWGVVIGNNDVVCKLSTTPLLDCGIAFPITHPHIMDERMEPVEIVPKLAPDLHWSVKGCHVAYATNMCSVENLNQIFDKLDERARIGVLVDGLKGLQHLHNLGVAYCDFKRDQILAVPNEGGFMGKLSDLESLRPIGFSGEYLGNQHINEDFIYNRDAFSRSSGRAHLPIDTARDVFSVAVELIHILLLPNDHVFRIKAEVTQLVESEDIDDAEFTTRLKKIIEGKVDNADYILRLPRDDARVHFNSNQSRLGEKFIHQIAEAYRNATSKKSRQKLREQFTGELKPYMPEQLAEYIVRALGNIRNERPSLPEIIQMLEKLYLQEATAEV